MPLDLKEGRHIKAFLGVKHIAAVDKTFRLQGATYVVMSFSEGIIDFSDGSTESFCVPIDEEPETHGVEDITEHPRHGNEDDMFVFHIHMLVGCHMA